MPVADTELLFALNPRDPKHHHALERLKRMSNVVVPDTSTLEFQMVLRGRGRRAGQVRDAMLALHEALRRMNAREERTMSIALLALQCDLEESHGLTYFDSLIAASALTLDGEIISDDTAFDKIPSLRRIPLSI
ncbi:PIN domain-containing protein [Candidatus Bathyarchaeota archaeon]|nr:PIN domain-containing protein [Candidatus Bathyarchaeota archaeon]